MSHQVVLKKNKYGTCKCDDYLLICTLNNVSVYFQQGFNIYYMKTESSSSVEQFGGKGEWSKISLILTNILAIKLCVQ